MKSSSADLPSSSSSAASSSSTGVSSLSSTSASPASPSRSFFSSSSSSSSSTFFSQPPIEQKKLLPACFNYYCVEDQKIIIESILDNVNSSLNNYLKRQKQKPHYVDPAESKTPIMTLAEVNHQVFAGKDKILGTERRIAIERLATALHNEIKAIPSIIPPTSKDVKHIKSFTSSILSRLKLAKTILDKIENQYIKKFKSNLNRELDNLIDTNTKLFLSLDYAMVVHTYEVCIPKTDYERFVMGAKKVFYEGRPTATGKTLVGTLGTIVFGGLVVAELGTGAFVADVLYCGGNGLKFLGEATCASAELAASGPSRFGYAGKTDIPPSWVRSLVKLHSPENPTGITRIKTNPSFCEVPSGDAVTIYVLDGRDPEFFFQNGSNHYLEGPDRDDENRLNRHGHTLYFHDRDDALRCAQERANGIMYDAIGGWRINSAWTLEERNAVYNLSDKIQEKIVSDQGNPFSSDIANLIAEYASPLSRVRRG